MGIPFNFTCSGIGHYVCSRCGNELFSTEDKVKKHETPFPISFSKTITDDSVVKIRQPIPPPRRNTINRPSNSEAFPTSPVSQIGKIPTISIFVKIILNPNLIDFIPPHRLPVEDVVYESELVKDKMDRIILILNGNLFCLYQQNSAPSHGRSFSKLLINLDSNNNGMT